MVRGEGPSRWRVGSGQTQKDKEPRFEQALAVPMMAPSVSRTSEKLEGQRAGCLVSWSLHLGWGGETEPGYRAGRLQKRGGGTQGARELGCLAPPKHGSPFQDVPLLPTQALGHLPLL